MGRNRTIFLTNSKKISLVLHNLPDKYYQCNTVFVYVNFECVMTEKGEAARRFSSGLQVLPLAIIIFFISILMFLDKLKIYERL